jgi:hypothetical protein
MQSQANEIQALKARLECYKKNQAPLANDNPLQALFADQDTIDHVKVASTLSKDDGKKLVLPDVVPGFKASSLKVGKCPFPHTFPMHDGTARFSTFSLRIDPALE